MSTANSNILAPAGTVMWWDGGERAITAREKCRIEEHSPSCFTIPLAPPVDLDNMLADCVPGGSITDPQVVADNIRAWFAKPAKLAEQQAVGVQRWEIVLVEGDSENRALLDEVPDDEGDWVRHSDHVRAIATPRKQQVGEVQGDALADAARRVLSESDFDGEISKGAYDALHAALADRQPGARVPVGYWFTDDPAKFAMPGSGFHPGAEPPADAIDVVPVYDAPPARGIDLVPRPMDTAPRDGTMVRLLVQFTEHATEDTAGPAWTIGACNDNNVGELEWGGWQFAGWCWTHDHFTEGKGTPVGWLPLIDDQRDAAPGVGNG